MSKRTPATPLSTNKHLLQWVKKMADLCQPESIHWVDGSAEENESFYKQMVAGGDADQAEPEALAGVLLRPV
jgi:phosphoenolpyruvate carboxykinase (GTP)